MALVYLTPFESESNEYINIIRHLLTAEGHTVRRFQPKSMRLSEYTDLLDKNTFIIYHWAESLAFKNNGKTIKFSPSGFAKWILYYIIAFFGRAKVIYFIHNHAVHDSEGWTRKFSSLLIRFFSKSANVRVVHDPGCCDQYDARYIPHPLYHNYPKKLTGSDADINNDLRSILSKIRSPLYSIIGAIRPYKKIDEILEHWPSEKTLFIAGKASPEYLADLHKTIERRNISLSVKIHPHFLSQADLNFVMNASSCIILPHETGSGLVSGAFFEAIGNGCAIITRSSPFTQAMSDKIPDIYNFETPEDIPRLLAIPRLNKDNASAKASIRQTAETLFGDAICRKSLSQAMATSKVGGA